MCEENSSTLEIAETTLKYSGPANLVHPNVYSEIVAAAALASLVQVGHAAAAAARSARGDA